MTQIHIQCKQFLKAYTLYLKIFVLILNETIIYANHQFYKQFNLSVIDYINNFFPKKNTKMSIFETINSSTSKNINNHSALFLLCYSINCVDDLIQLSSFFSIVTNLSDSDTHLVQMLFEGIHTSLKLHVFVFHLK